MLYICILCIMNELQPMLLWLGCVYKASWTGVKSFLCMELYGSPKCAQCVTEYVSGWGECAGQCVEGRRGT